MANGTSCCCCAFLPAFGRFDELVAEEGVESFGDISCCIVIFPAAKCFAAGDAFGSEAEACDDVGCPCCVGGGGIAAVLDGVAIVVVAGVVIVAAAVVVGGSAAIFSDD